MEVGCAQCAKITSLATKIVLFVPTLVEYVQAKMQGILGSSSSSSTVMQQSLLQLTVLTKNRLKLF
jgi:hypothetical protein